MDQGGCEQDLIVRGPRQHTPETNESLGDHYYRRLLQHGDKVAQLQQVDGRIVSCTFSVLLRQAKSITNYLRQRGLGTGDVIVIRCSNTLEFMPIMLATLFLGATVAPTNPTFDADETLRMLQLTRPALVICDIGSQDVVREVVSKCDRPVPWINMDTIVRIMANTDKVTEPFLVERVDPRNVAFLVYSSGSTGRPKAVEMIHSSLLLQLDMPLFQNIMNPCVTPEVVLNMSGPYWATCQITMLITLDRGMRLVLLNGFTPERFLDSIQTFKVNSSILGTDQFVQLAKYRDFDRYDISSVCSLIVGGAPVPIGMFNVMQTKFNNTMTQLFGMTECMAVVKPAFGVHDKPGNVGTLVKNVDAKIVDTETGEILGRNREGELCFRSPSMMKGYRYDPAGTAAAFDDAGFVRTGDVGLFDDDGYLYIKDRIKDLIKYKRYYVRGMDIEEVLLRHSEVSDAAVVGIYHMNHVEVAAGLAVLTPGATATAQELLGLIEAELPSHKWLYGGLRLVNSIPRTATGKIRKKAVREMVSKST